MARTTRTVGLVRQGDVASDGLERVTQLFARFRAGHPAGTRIPDSLRAAVLSALEGGVPRGPLFRACGLSGGQVAGWAAAMPDATGRRPVRLFAVEDAGADEAGPDAAAGEEVTVRVGPWSVTLRREGWAERGCACCR